MKFSVHKDGYVDLETPIHMTEEQREAFIEFFKKMFPGEVSVGDTVEPPVYTGEREGTTPKRWTVEEYVMLLDPERNLRVANKIGRSEMSIQMKRGEFVPGFLAWVKEKGYSLIDPEELVRLFFKEMGRVI